MFRVLTAFILLMMMGPASYGQSVKQLPVFKNGQLTTGNSLLNHKLSHPLLAGHPVWQGLFRGSSNGKGAGRSQTDRTLRKGNPAGTILAGNHWLAICNSAIQVKTLPALGIKNLLCDSACDKTQCPTPEY